jgi:hypothetical protein
LHLPHSDFLPVLACRAWRGPTFGLGLVVADRLGRQRTTTPMRGGCRLGFDHRAEQVGDLVVRDRPRAPRTQFVVEVLDAAGKEAIPPLFDRGHGYAQLYRVLLVEAR